jgi:hypothetical protein
MNKYCFIEHFANDCTTPCLVGDLSPYDFTQALYLAGKNYRIAHSVEPITMEDIESFTNHVSSMDAVEMREEAMKTISEFVPDECFLDTYLNSNLKFKLEGDTYPTHAYQVDIKIVKVPDSDNYRFVCNPHKIGPGKYQNGYFLKVDSSKKTKGKGGTANDYNELILSKDPLYLTNTDVVLGSSPEAQRAADLFNEYNGTAMEVEEFANYENTQTQNNMDQFIVNPDNTLLFRFWKTYDQKVLINVFDNGQAASGSVAGEDPVNYGYMIYNDITNNDNSITFIDRSMIFPSSLNEQNDAGAEKRLINLNYDLLVPYKVPGVALDKYLKTNIKFPSKGESEGELMIMSYYINDDDLFYIYRCEVNINGEGTKYGFSIDLNNTNITIKKRCKNENMLFTFWQTLDKQFIIAKCIENTISNCDDTYNEDNTGSAAVNNRINLKDQNYNLIGLKNDTNELSIIDRFVDTLHFNIDTIQVQVDPIDSFIKYIQELAITRINALIEEEINKQQASLTVPSVDDEDKCNDRTFNFVLFLKILSMCIALFLFLDLDYSEHISIKIFKGFFAMLFSEIYLVYQFVRIVIYGA